ncbi:hypothetical protein EPO44_13400 [bacterium]|nr:MAG: hypothetical protein EPO44_13400 [bacterium]
MEERMSQGTEGDRKQKGEKSRRKKSSKLRLLTGIILASSLLFGLAFSLSSSEPWGLPAIPRNPRPATLSPDLFTGKEREAYRIAQEVPELLERTPCYCGCYVNPGHRNNLDCYTDRHSVG